MDQLARQVPLAILVQLVQPDLKDQPARLGRLDPLAQLDQVGRRVTQDLPALLAPLVKLDSLVRLVLLAHKAT